MNQLRRSVRHAAASRWSLPRCCSFSPARADAFDTGAAHRHHARRDDRGGVRQHGDRRRGREQLAGRPLLQLQEDPAVRPREPDDRDPRVAARPARGLAEEGDGRRRADALRLVDLGRLRRAPGAARVRAHTARDDAGDPRSIKAAGGAIRRDARAARGDRDHAALAAGLLRALELDRAAGLAGADGPDWSRLTLRPHADLLRRAGGGPQHSSTSTSATRPSTSSARTAAGTPNDNKSLEKGVNKDWPGRPGYDDAYMSAYFATRQWLRALRPRHRRRTLERACSATPTGAAARSTTTSTRRPEDRDDDRPLAGPGRAVRPVALVERLR